MTKYLCIAGDALNWAWSLRDYKSDVLSNSFKDKRPPPDFLNKIKDSENILWAFNDSKIYEKLKRIVDEDIVKCILVTNTWERNEYNIKLSRGIIAFGIISQNYLIDKVIWNYWPYERVGKPWDYKFFIKIEKIAPSILKNLEKLKQLSPEDFKNKGSHNIANIFNLWKKDVINVIPASVTQGSLHNVNETTFLDLNFLSEIRWRKRPSPPPSALNENKLILVHLYAGKNIILSGPPGCGKTMLAKKIARIVCGDDGFSLVTANPQWTIFDVIGGLTLPKGIFKKGFLTYSVINCWKRLKKQGKPYWLIIDEINRGNIDTAFGQAFTLLDISHRKNILLLDYKEELIEQNIYNLTPNSTKGLMVPYSFRIIATMNSYDRALLFKLGFALLRRFAVIPSERISYLLKSNDKNFLNSVQEIVSDFDKNKSVLNIQLIENDLRLAYPESNDYALISAQLYKKFINMGISKYDSYVKSKLGFSPIIFIESLRQKINDLLIDTGIEITAALIADVLKFLVVSYLYLDESSVDCFQDILDEALASYMLPQLDILSDKIRAERMGIGEGITLKAISNVKNLVNSLGLKRSLAILNRLNRGESIL